MSIFHFISVGVEILSIAFRFVSPAPHVPFKNVQGMGNLEGAYLRSRFVQTYSTTCRGAFFNHNNETMPAKVAMERKPRKVIFIVYAHSSDTFEFLAVITCSNGQESFV